MKKLFSFKVLKVNKKVLFHGCCLRMGKIAGAEWEGGLVVLPKNNKDKLQGILEYEKEMGKCPCQLTRLLASLAGWLS